jgi:hypothetical protein
MTTTRLTSRLALFCTAVARGVGECLCYQGATQQDNWLVSDRAKHESAISSGDVWTNLPR